MPPVRLARTSRFQRAYLELDERYRKLVQKALAQFLADPTYPGLHAKRIQGTEAIWEMRAGTDIRTTFHFEQDQDGTRAIVLRNLGHHDPTRANH
jgi:mRNA-degrading endonuclease RelE of RelBE toxin-antitoxin system